MYGGLEPFWEQCLLGGLMKSIKRFFPSILIGGFLLVSQGSIGEAADVKTELRLSWAKNSLTVHGEHRRGQEVKIGYLEDYSGGNDLLIETLKAAWWGWKKSAL